MVDVHSMMVEVRANSRNHASSTNEKKVVLLRKQTLVARNQL